MEMTRCASLHPETRATISLLYYLLVSKLYVRQHLLSFSYFDFGNYFCWMEMGWSKINSDKNFWATTR
jgi:hypothetical protein